MAGKGTELRQFLAAETAKYRNIMVPVSASLFRRMTTKKLPLSRLHPNPDDEFCFPEIGPSEGIVARYARSFSQYRADYSGARLAGDDAYEPIVVQKVRPDGYMILNGHHRWAGAIKAGLDRIPARIVNLATPDDIRKTLANVHNRKRVAMDLDEVVFCASDSEPAEPALRFPWNRLYPQRIRRGIPANFYYLSQHGYDVWCYSSRYESEDQIRRLLKLHHAHVTGVITGTSRKRGGGNSTNVSIEKMVFRKYEVTVHVDQKSLLRINSASREFQEYRFSGEAEWVHELQEAFRKLGRDE